MKSHHTTTLHQFTLLSRRGVRLHLKNQAQQESLKKTLFENTHHLTQPINFGNYSLPPSFTLEKSKKKDSHSPQLHATTFAAFTFNYEKLSTVTPCL